jgi:hypothetical protein
MLGHHCKLLWPIDRPSSLSSILLKAHGHDVYPSENLPPETKSPPPNLRTVSDANREH